MNDIEEFVDALYGDSEGWVYVPTKAPARDKDWTKNFFEWPRERGRIVKFIQDQSLKKEVYIAPALFKEDLTNVRLSKEAWKETRVLWAEFDGNAPDPEGLSIPAPSIRVRSSYDGHEHWYWRLPHSESNPNAVESLNKRLAYELGADKSGFDYQQVLRPPETVHHKSGGQLRTTLLVCGDRPVSPGPIVNLPEPPAALEIEVDTKNLPKIHQVIAYNNWDADTLELIFEKTPAKGKLSSSMFRIASECFNSGMSSTDVLALMVAVDAKWGKFKGRSDRMRRLKGLVTNAKSIQVATGEDTDKPTEFLEMKHMVEDNADIEWVIPDYVYRGSLVQTVGKGSVGKTQFNLRTAIHLCIGKPFLNFKIAKPHKIVFVSLEMDKKAFKKFIMPMLNDFNEEEKELFFQNFRMFFPDSAFYMNDSSISRLIRKLEEFRPDGVIVDSLGVATKGDVKSDENMIALFNSMKYHIQKKFDCFVWFIHHNRKATGDNKKPRKADDIFGSVYIYNSADTVIGMWRDDEFSPIEIYCLKMRMAEYFTKMFVKRTENLNFEMVSLGAALNAEGGANGNRDPGPEARFEPGIGF